MYSFSIDRGGTFTDLVCRKPNGDLSVLKLLSVDPKNYEDAPREGIRRLLELCTGVPHPRGAPIPTRQIASIRMGTTVATNALLERAGSSVCLLVSKGFRDVLRIGNQSRPRIFDLAITRPDVLYSSVIEVDARVLLAAGAPLHPDYAALPRVNGTTGEVFLVERPVDAAAVRAALTAARASGITACAIALLHSYSFTEHERAVAALAAECGFTQISCSHDLMPTVKLVPRGHTACADAYLTPVISAYLHSFASGFEGGLGLSTPSAAAAAAAPPAHTPALLFMQSDGGLSTAQSFSGFRAVLSGPAGGCVGYAATTVAALGPAAAAQIVAFDMGGTSTDVSRYAQREGWDFVLETTTAGVTLCAPQLDINTVAAGGGSVLEWREGLLCVGPASTGADPGPVCYRKGGRRLAVTDANVALGRVIPQAFPAIFGPGENEPLDAEGARQAFAALAQAINSSSSSSGSGSAAAFTPDTLAAGFIAVANESMCRPIRALTQMRGHDLTQHIMACFGGAGPQHACAVAKALGISTIFISRHSSVLSAYGLMLADVVVECQAPVSETLLVLAKGEDDAAAAAAAASAGSEPSGCLSRLAARVLALCKEAGSKLQAQAAPGSQQSISYFPYLRVRYAGTDAGIFTPLAWGGEGAGIPHAQLHSAALTPTLLAALALSAPHFVALYEKEYGFKLRGREIVVDDVRVRAVAKEPQGGEAAEAAAAASAAATAAALQHPLPAPTSFSSTYFQGLGRVSTPLFHLEQLHGCPPLPGPAILVDRHSTIVIDQGWAAEVLASGDIRLTDRRGAAQQQAAVAAAAAAAAAALAAATTATPSSAPPPSLPPSSSSSSSSTPSTPPLRRWQDSPLIAWSPTSAATLAAAHPCDPIQLSIFAHRFMGIAEQCGRTLQRTSVSVNMRERLDYSCALFGPDGGLIANAPHIPVHLGAMQEAVRCQLALWGGGLAPGDVLLSNHPQLAGGSHLPDMTVITPVWSSSSSSQLAQPPRILFFCACRGHHSDVGGISPGSMPPHSQWLSEEGCAIVAFKLVTGSGGFEEGGVSALLAAAGARNIPDVLSDLRAQVAANHRGSQLVQELIAASGLGVVHAYMAHIQAAAEGSVRGMLKAYCAAQAGAGAAQQQQQQQQQQLCLRAEDFMDDGSPIRLAVTIDSLTGSAVFDFSGTGPEVIGNTNAPLAVTYSAVIYCLRCMVGADIPLNQGALAPITIHIPPGTLLHPSPASAVVGGNVLTSQRCVDVILRAFGVCGASSGCMNNLTFGNESFGFYETISAGAGGGPGWVGASGVHTHMTNTRITDSEILERRYPVILRAFHLRSGSGGSGAFPGGQGVVRELEFRCPLTVSILSERRAFAPWGAAGGGEGARGRNTLLRRGEGAASGGVARVVNLGGKASFAAGAGDVLRIETPGGGGYGAAGGEAAEGGALAGGGGGGWRRVEEGGAAPRAAGSLAALAETESEF